MGAINAGVYAGNPSCKFLHCKAGAAVTKGDVVQWSATADDGITVLVAAANTIPVGIAQNTAVTGGTVKVQTRGQGIVAITSTGTTTAAGDYLYAAANADVTDVAVGSTSDADTALCAVGLATVTTGATALPLGTYIVTAPCSWWESGTVNGGIKAGYPTKKYMTVKAGAAAITKGEVVAWDTATAVDGMTVIAAGADTIPVGVAIESVAAGAYLRVQTRGLGDVALTTDDGAAAGDMLFTAAAGAVDDVAVGSLSGDEADPLWGCVGLALADDVDASHTQAAGTYVIMCPNSWWDDDAINPVTIGTPSRKFLTVKAAAAITAGDIVSMSTVADDGITVVAGSATGIPAGVAIESAAAGAKLRIQTRGVGLVAITNDGTNIAAGDPLVAAATKAVTGLTAGSGLVAQSELLFGVALAAETTTTCAAGSYIVMCPHSWWD